VVIFVVFKSKESGREYSFEVREMSQEPREFKVTIDQHAFNKKLLKIQDGPDVCSARLRRELISTANRPTESHFHITTAELDEYREKHTPPKRSMFHSPRKEEEY
jgi:hypothetical protein